MAKKMLDTTGLKCPQPILKIAVMVRRLVSGDVLEVKADCDPFEADVRKWCERMGKVLLRVTTDDNTTTARIQF